MAAATQNAIQQCDEVADSCSFSGVLRVSERILDWIGSCHEHIIHDGIHKFPQQIVRIPAAPISPNAKLETKTSNPNDSQF